MFLEDRLFVAYESNMASATLGLCEMYERKGLHGKRMITNRPKVHFQESPFVEVLTCSSYEFGFPQTCQLVMK
jgi:hypothetical protein